jgi:uncharacterized membrane protein (UPF0127 family)
MYAPKEVTIRRTRVPGRRRKSIVLLGIAMGAVVVINGFGCVGSPAGNGDDEGSASRRRFPLETLPTATVTIKGAAFRVWLALDEDRREEGLMFVPVSEIAADQGMLFVFPDERYLGFWMKNTITALDIAYARMDGTIVTTHTMPILTLRTYPSYEPAMFALEVKAGTFQRLGIGQGDRIDIPDRVFKAQP